MFYTGVNEATWVAILLNCPGLSETCQLGKYREKIAKAFTSGTIWY